MYCRCMGTVFVLGAIRIEVRTREGKHLRPHVHAVGPGADASIAIDGLFVAVLASTGFSKKTLGQIEAFVEQHKLELLEAWNEIHNEK